MGWFRWVGGAARAENLARAAGKVKEAAKRGAQIICLQELFRSQYFCQVEDHKYFQLAEEIPGPTTHAPRRTQPATWRRDHRLTF